MTFRDLQKLMEQDQENQGHIGLSVEMTRLLNDCPKMFYKWNDKNHWSQHEKTMLFLGLDWCTIKG